MAMFKVPWHVAVESVRLYVKLIEEISKTYLSEGGMIYDLLLSQHKITLFHLQVLENFGPVRKEVDLLELPPPWQDCEDVEEVKRSNRIFQQMIADGEDLPIQELLYIEGVTGPSVESPDPEKQLPDWLTGNIGN